MGFEVQDMGNHRVLFVFTSEEDVDQVHDIPIRSASMDMAKEIVSLAGEVVEDVFDEGQQDKYNFMRLRVTIDITKPLCRGQRITMARGVKIKGPQNVRDKQFGSWLHATTPHPSRKSVIQVEGYDEDSGDEGVVDIGINANDQRGDLNAGVTKTGSAGSEEGRQSIPATEES
nr:hypothetical protein CFP56_18023 [Quercus suber]